MSRGASDLFAARVVRHVHRQGPHVAVSVILLVIIVVAVILFIQRRRDHKIADVAVPMPSASAPAPLVASSPDTEATIAPVATRGPRTMPPGRYGMLGLLQSEWTKLRTVRSTMWTLGVTIVLGIGLSALVCAETRSHWSSTNQLSRLTFDPTSISLIGVLIGEFAVGILGVLVMSAEYGTGTIRSTFAGAPRRPMVLAAKATVFGATILVVAEVVAFLSFLLGQALLTAPTPHTTLASPGALRAVVGCGLYLFLLGLFALGLATIIRHTAGAVSAFIGVLLVLPIIVAVLPSTLSQDLQRYLPDHVGAAVISLHNGANFFSPWIGLLVLAGYAAAALIIGGVLLVRRDA